MTKEITIKDFQAEELFNFDAIIEPISQFLTSANLRPFDVPAFLNEAFAFAKLLAINEKKSVSYFLPLEIKRQLRFKYDDKDEQWRNELNSLITVHYEANMQTIGNINLGLKALGGTNELTTLVKERVNALVNHNANFLAKPEIIGVAKKLKGQATIVLKPLWKKALWHLAFLQALYHLPLSFYEPEMGEPSPFNQWISHIITYKAAAKAAHLIKSYYQKHNIQSDKPISYFNFGLSNQNLREIAHLYNPDYLALNEILLHSKQVDFDFNNNSDLYNWTINARKHSDNLDESTLEQINNLELEWLLTWSYDKHKTIAAYLGPTYNVKATFWPQLCAFVGEEDATKVAVKVNEWANKDTTSTALRMINLIYTPLSKITFAKGR